jgi:radical SAM superfamily enzyme YgiQ (UPF0313 family)
VPGQLLEAEAAVDAVFVGEAEGSFAQAARRLSEGVTSLHGIQGLRTRGWDGGPGPRPEDLDGIPEVELTEEEVRFLRLTAEAAGRPPQVPVEVSRGCPGRCAFCSTRRHFGRRVRRREAGRVVAEMRRIAARWGLRSFELVGDHAGAPLRSLLAFAERVAADASHLRWQCDLKLDRARPEHLEVLWRGGCRGFFVGVESASQETLDRLGKGVRIDRELEVIRRALELGFEVKPSFIVGFPWETDSMVQQTYELHAELLRAGAKDSQIWLLCPLPGTDLAESCPSTLDPLVSRLGADGLPLEPDDLERVRRFPRLFAHLRRFETPRVAPETLTATVAAAAQLRALFDLTAE